MAENGDAPMPPAPEEEAPPPAPGQEPNQTLYIKNIDETLSRRYRLEELKAKLKNLFRPYGEILDIVALSNYYDKGQAFVVFKTVEMAEKAMAALQGHVMSGKEMKIFYARSKSDAVAKLDGTYKQREKRVRPKPQPKPKAQQAEGGDSAMADAHDASAPAPAAHAPAGAAPYAGAPPGSGPPPGFGAGGAPPPGFGHAPPPHGGQPPPGQPPMQTPPQPGGPPAPTLPHPILFVENLPTDATSETVSAVFSPFPGFKEVRLVPSRPGIGFAEFENEMQSGMAMQRLQGYKMEENPIKITFSKS